MSANQERQKTQWPVVWVCIGAGIVAATHIGKLPPALPEIRTELDAGLVTGGWIASMISCTGFALGLVAGSLADRFGQRRVLLFGLLAMAAGSLLGASAQSGDTMLAARFVEGLGFTATTITGAAIIVRVTANRDRRWALGIWSSYVPVGFALMLIFGALILEAFGWRILWHVCTVLTLAWAALVWAVTRGWQRRQGTAVAVGTLVGNLRRTLGTTGAVLVACCFAVYAAQHIGMMNWLPTYVTEVYGATPFFAAVVTAMVLAFNAGGNWLTAMLMNRGSAVWVLLLTGAVGMGATEIVIFAGGLPPEARFGVILLFGIFGGLIPAAAIGSVATYTPSSVQTGTMNGLMVMGTNTGQLFGPPALAAARESAGSWEGALWLVLTLAAVGTVLALLSRPLERRAALN